jgi:TonB-dependent receptor
MAEHYYSSVGILSMGVFSKNIKNFIYTFRSVTADDLYGPGTSGFTLFQPLNGEEANLYGVELVYQRQLDFLPGFARNISLDFNYTFLNSVTEGIRDVNGVDREDLNLPDTPPHIFNASLGYENKTFTARLSANYSAGYLKEVGGRDFEDIFYDQQLLIDLNASYQINKNLSVYGGLNNLTNQPLRLYQGIHPRTAQTGFYDRRLMFGLKYDVFKSK